MLISFSYRGSCGPTKLALTTLHLFPSICAIIILGYTMHEYDGQSNPHLLSEPWNKHLTIVRNSSRKYTMNTVTAIGGGLHVYLELGDS
jgi:hypothetical protein